MSAGWMLVSASRWPKSTLAMALAISGLVAPDARAAEEAQAPHAGVNREGPVPGPSDVSPLYMSEGFTAPRLIQANCVGSNTKIPDKLVGPVPSSLTAKFPVGADGIPGAVTVLSHDVPASLVEAVRSAILGCRWEPGLDASGKPQPIWVILPVRFGGGASDEGLPASAEPGMSTGPSIEGPRFMELPVEWRTPERRRFFNQIKQAVAEIWSPMDAARALDPTGTQLFQKPRTTVLAVTLNPKGGITEIKVARSCGLDVMDKVALDAFVAAQPFANPPEGLADERGRIRFTFGFHMTSAMTR